VEAPLTEARRDGQTRQQFVLDADIPDLLRWPFDSRIGILVAPDAERDISRRADLVLLCDVVVVGIVPRSLIGCEHRRVVRAGIRGSLRFDVHAEIPFEGRLALPGEVVCGADPRRHIIPIRQVRNRVEVPRRHESA
jgi:hypothetical protein